MCEPRARELLASQFLETLPGRKRPNKPEECTGQKPGLCSSFCRGLTGGDAPVQHNLCVFLLGQAALGSSKWNIMSSYQKKKKAFVNIQCLG